MILLKINKILFICVTSSAQKVNLVKIKIKIYSFYFI